MLEVKGLTVERPEEMGERGIGLRNVSLSLGRDEILVLAGETGCGKSALVRMVVGLPGPGVRALDGEILFDGRDLLKLRSRDRRKLRRGEIAAVGRGVHEQFNPERTVRRWLREAVRLSGNRELDDEKKWSDFFYRVGIVEPERILKRTMGDLSSLVVQRLMLMRALIGKARLIVCDEATAGLDRIAERQFIELLSRIRGEEQVAVLLTTGSLRGVDRYADRVAVFYEGGILEAGPSHRILDNPTYAYTREFFLCAPRITHLPRELATISREASREAEEVVHRRASPIQAPEDVAS